MSINPALLVLPLPNIRWSLLDKFYGEVIPQYENKVMLHVIDFLGFQIIRNTPLRVGSNIAYTVLEINTYLDTHRGGIQMTNNGLADYTWGEEPGDYGDYEDDEIRFESVNIEVRLSGYFNDWLTKPTQRSYEIIANFVSALFYRHLQHMAGVTYPNLLKGYYEDLESQAQPFFDDLNNQIEDVKANTPKAANVFTFIGTLWRQLPFLLIGVVAVWALD